MTTEEKLLVSARELFANNGYVTTKVEDITHNANVAKGTFYTYFKTKEDIFIKIIHTTFEKTKIEIEKLEFSGGLKKDIHLFVGNLYDGAYNDKETFKLFSNIFTSPELMKKLFFCSEAPRGKEILKNTLENIFQKNKEEVEEEIFVRNEFVYRAIDEMLKTYLGSILGFGFPPVKENLFEPVKEEELEGHIMFITNLIYKAVKK